MIFTRYTMEWSARLGLKPTLPKTNTLKEKVGFWFPLANGQRVHGRHLINGNVWYIKFASERRCQTYIDRMNRHEQSRYKWTTIWQQAYDNCPSRRGKDVNEDWHPINEPVPVADYIKGLAYDEMKLIDGTVHKKTVSVRYYRYGQYAAMSRLIGYAEKRGGHNRIYQNMHRGACPRDPERQVRLMKLADPKTGRQWAIDKLTEMGIIKYYDFVND